MKTRVAVLARFPEGLLAGLRLLEQLADVRVDEGALRREAFMTVEGHLITGLVERPDLKVDVLTFADGPRSSRRVQFAANGTLHILPDFPGTGMPVGWLPKVLLANRYLREHVRPDIVHGVRTLTGYATLAAFSPFPHVVTIEEFVGAIEPPWHLRPVLWVGSYTETLTLRKAKHIVAVSDHVRRLVDQRTRGRIYRVPNMVGDAFYNVHKQDVRPEVVSIGRITPEKGTLDVLRAAAVLEREGITAKWIIIGGPTGHLGEAYLAQCEDFAKENLRHQHVEFVGWVRNEDICNYLTNAACAVFPSQAPYETFCISVAEAMATGTAPIVYDYGPLPEHVRDGVSGFVVPRGDVRAMAGRIRRLLADSDEARIIGQRARERALSYRRDQVAKRLVDLYCHILAGETDSQRSYDM